MENFDIQDDMNVDPTSYPDRETGVRPPLPGNYLVKAGKWAFRTKKGDGSLVMWKDKYPVIGLSTVEITDPSDYARKVVVFQDIPTMPFTREGKTASQAADVLRSLDATATAGNTGEVIKAVTERLTGGSEFRVRIDYRAYDSAYAKSLVAELGPNPSFEDKNECYDKAKIQGYRKIRSANAAAGQSTLPLHKWVGPSGNVVDVQPVITVFYPASDTTVQLGPDKEFLS